MFIVIIWVIINRHVKCDDCTKLYKKKDCDLDSDTYSISCLKRLWSRFFLTTWTPSFFVGKAFQAYRAAIFSKKLSPQLYKTEHTLVWSPEGPIMRFKWFKLTPFYVPSDLFTLKEHFTPETTKAYFIVDWDTINTILGSFWD